MTTKRPAAPTRKTVASDDNAAIMQERLRISAILESAAGRRNPNLAMKLALYSQLDAETANSLLADAPAANPYLAAMEQQGQIGLSAPVADFSNDPKAARLKEIEELGARMRTQRRREQGLPVKD